MRHIYYYHYCIIIILYTIKHINLDISIYNLNDATYATTNNCLQVSV